MSLTTCFCSEDFGPCEDHSTLLAQREGSSSRSADELCHVFLLDALDIDPDVLAPYGLDVLARATAALSDASWIDDPELADELRDLVWQVESNLPAVTFWEDGYRIVTLSEDCPL